MLRQQQAVLIAEQEHNEMLEAELKAMREQLNANQVWFLVHLATRDRG